MAISKEIPATTYAKLKSLEKNHPGFAAFIEPLDAPDIDEYILMLNKDHQTILDKIGSSVDNINTIIPPENPDTIVQAAEIYISNSLGKIDLNTHSVSISKASLFLGSTDQDSFVKPIMGLSFVSDTENPLMEEKIEEMDEALYNHHESGDLMFAQFISLERLQRHVIELSSENVTYVRENRESIDYDFTVAAVVLTNIPLFDGDEKHQSTGEEIMQLCQQNNLAAAIVLESIESEENYHQHLAEQQP